MKKWKKVTPIPIEFNGHGYLFTCTKCGRCTTYLGGKKEPPYDCPKCTGEEEKKNG